MTALIYLAAYWPLAAIITCAVLCRAIHQGKIRETNQMRVFIA